MKLIANILRACRARPFAVALLFYQVAFFNIFLPGHTRGSITLDGKRTRDAAAASCCSYCCESSTPEKTTDSKDARSKKDRENCAICHFAARVLPTPFVSFVLLEIGLLELMPPVAPATPVQADLWSTLHSRGPPSIHA